MSDAASAPLHSLLSAHTQVSPVEWFTDHWENILSIVESVSGAEQWRVEQCAGPIIYNIWEHCYYLGHKSRHHVSLCKYQFLEKLQQSVVFCEIFSESVVLRCTGVGWYLRLRWDWACSTWDQQCPGPDTASTIGDSRLIPGSQFIKTSLNQEQMKFCKQNYLNNFTK